MLSVLLFIDNELYSKALAEASRGTKSVSLAKGRLGEDIVGGVFKSAERARDISGKADIRNVRVDTVVNIFSTIDSGLNKSLTKELRESFGTTLDIEAKATGKFLGGFQGSQRGTIKITQATASIKSLDSEYLQRAETLIVSILELGLVESSPSKIEEVKKLFKSLEVNNDVSLKDFEEQIFKAIGGSRGRSLLKNAYDRIMQNPVKFKEFLNGPFGVIIKDKVRNLSVQVNARLGDKSLTFFQTFFNLQFTTEDIVAKKAGSSYTFSLSSKFEKRLLQETRKKLENNAVGTINSDLNNILNFYFGGKTSLQAILGASKNISSKELAKNISFTSLTFSIPTGGSIPLNFGIDASNLIAKTINTLPTLLSRNVKRGRFMSTEQLTPIFQAVVLSKLNKSGPPRPPMLTSRTGRFIENLQITQINYKNRIIQYYSNPIYYSLEKYGYRVEETLTGSIREITQQLFSRQFNLVRA